MLRKRNFLGYFFLVNTEMREFLSNDDRTKTIGPRVDELYIETHSP